MSPCQAELHTNDQSNSKSILNFTNTCIYDVIGMEFNQRILSAYYLLTSGYYSVLRGFLDMRRDSLIVVYDDIKDLVGR